MPSRENSRRVFLKRVVTASSALAVGSASVTSSVAAADAPAAPSTPAPTPAPTGYQYLSPDESAFVEALVNVMCPDDGLTPNGVDCGLAEYIDRQLAGGFGHGERLYRQPPWRLGKPQLGYQLPLTPAQFFSTGVATTQSASVKNLSKRFEELASVEADAFLIDVAAGKFDDERLSVAHWFNDLVYPLFTQACFADPLYGGNRDKVFWKLIGYPGLPAFNSQNIVTYRGKPFPAAAQPKSILDFS
jgi:gluconate 2-dehydrogenase gamma chain